MQSRGHLLKSRFRYSPRNKSLPSILYPIPTDQAAGEREIKQNCGLFPAITSKSMAVGFSRRSLLRAWHTLWKTGGAMLYFAEGSVFGKEQLHE